LCLFKKDYLCSKKAGYGQADIESDKTVKTGNPAKPQNDIIRIAGKRRCKGRV
jgi:hypothetical protein